MSYKYSNGRYQIIGDLSGSDDANRDTGIDFEENEIKLVAGGVDVFKVSGSHVYLDNGSHLYLGGNSKLFFDADDGGNNIDVFMDENGTNHFRIDGNNSISLIGDEFINIQKSFANGTVSNQVSFNFNNNVMNVFMPISSSQDISGSKLHLQEGITLGGQSVIDNQASLSVGSITLVDQSGPVYQLPNADGTSGQVIMTDGSGNLTFSDVSGASGGTSQFFQGHVEIGTTAQPANFHNVVSIGANAPENFKSWFIAPFTGQINKVILSVKANNFSTSNHGTITVAIYKNQSNFNSATSIAVAADNFAQTVNNLGSTNGDVNTGIFNTSVSIQEGDLIQIKVGKSVGTSGEFDDAVITLRLTEQ
jgi:3D (Asp-Asp-Asp) domain-containing protein